MDTPALAKEGYRYFAFISYSHKDKKWASLIQKKLESYKLPNVIRKESDRELPKRIFPVFRDEDDLGPGSLTDKLRTELEASKFLIVICSPNSARMNDVGKCWVNEEVAYFATTLGRANRIIPVIIEGTVDDAFCATLKECDILALDATKTSKPRIVNDIVAAILDLRPDDLWQRELRRIARKRTCGILVSMFLSLIGAFAGFSVWDNNRDVYKYYTATNQRFGIDHGLGEISAAQAKTAKRYVRFYYRGYDRHPLLGGERILRRVSQIETNGAVAENQYRYSEKGHLSSIDVMNGHGTIAEQRIYADGNTNSCEVVTYENGSPMRQGGERLFIYFDEETGGVAYVRNQHFDGKYERVSFFNSPNGGRTELREYFNADGTRGADEYGTPIILHQKVFNPSRPDGFMEVGQQYFDEFTNRFVNAQGVSGFTNRQNHAKRFLDVINIDTSDAPVDSIDGYAIERSYYDDFDRPFKVWRLNHVGEKVKDRDFGCYGLSISYDFLDGEIEKMTLTNERGEPMFSDTVHYAEVHYSRGINSRAIRYHDATNAPCITINGTAGCDEEYDYAGRLIRLKYVNLHGATCTNAEGVAIRKMSYDNEGRLREERLIDAEGNPANLSTLFGNLPVEKISHSYDEAGNTIKKVNLVDGNSLGVKYFSDKTGPDGRSLAAWFENSNGRLCNSSLGYAKMEVTYNANGEWTEIAHYDMNGDLSNNEMIGASKILRMVKHKNGEILSEERYLSPNLLLSSSGICAVNGRFDRYGRLIDVEALDALGNPKTIKGCDFSEIHVRYDSQGAIDYAEMLYPKDSDVGGNIKKIRIDHSGKEGDVQISRYDANGERLDNEMASGDYDHRQLAKWIDFLSFKAKPSLDPIKVQDHDIRQLLNH